MTKKQQQELLRKANEQLAFIASHAKIPFRDSVFAVIEANYKLVERNTKKPNAR